MKATYCFVNTLSVEGAIKARSALHGQPALGLPHGHHPGGA